MSEQCFRDDSVTLLSERLAAAVSAGEWEAAAHMANERFTAIERVLSATSGDIGQQKALIQWLEQIKSRDAELIPLIAAEHANLARQLVQLHSTSQAERAYRKYSED